MFDSKSNYSMMPTVQCDTKDAFFDGFFCRQIDRQPPQMTVFRYLISVFESFSRKRAGNLISHECDVSI